MAQTPKCVVATFGRGQQSTRFRNSRGESDRIIIFPKTWPDPPGARSPNASVISVQGQLLLCKKYAAPERRKEEERRERRGKKERKKRKKGRVDLG